MADDLRRYLEHRPVLAGRNTPLLRSMRFMRRHRMVMGLTAAVLLACGVVLLALEFSVRRQVYARARRADVEHQVQNQATLLRLYETRLQLAADAVRAHQLGHANELLSQAAERQNEEPDLRGWEWGYLWNVAHSAFLNFIGRMQETRAVSISPDGRRLATGGSDTAVHVFDLTGDDPTPRSPLLTLNGHTTCVFSVDWIPDGKRLFSTDYGGNVRAWDAATGHSLPMAMANETGDCTGASLSPDGRHYAVAIQRRPVSVYDVNTAALAWQTPLPPPGAAWISVPAWSSDGTQMAVGLNDGSTMAWSFESDASGGLRERRPILRLRESAQIVQTVSFDRDGHSLACGLADGSVVVWDLATQQPRYKIQAHSDWVMGIAFSVDGTQFATCGRDSLVRRWESATGKPLQTHAGHTGWVFGITFDAENRVISGGSDSQLRRWADGPNEGSAIDRTPATTLPAASQPAVVFSPDGRRSVHFSDDGVLHVEANGFPSWSADAGPGRPALTFTADGSRVISGSGNGSVRAWDASTGQLLLQLDDAAPAAVVELSWKNGGTLVARTDSGETLRWKATVRGQ